MRRLTILLAATAALMLVSAAQALAAGPGVVNIVGAGSGEVTTVPQKGTPPAGSGTPPITCSYSSPGPQTGVCKNETPAPSAHVAFFAYPAPGSEFGSWEINKGEDYWAREASEPCGTYNAEGEELFGGPYCEMLNEAAPSEGLEITVCFVQEGEGEAGCEEGPPANVKLTIESGSGTVVSNPAGLSCSGEAVKSCEAALPEGKVVLTASPAPGYAFKSWKKCDTGGVNGRQCTITANATLKEIGASFIKVWNLKGTKSGGLGILGSSPGGVNCGYACTSSTAFYKEGSLTVKAKPAKNFHFVEFSSGTGSASSCNGVTAETCTITIAADSAVNEVYAENAKNTLTLTKEGGGQGFVKTKPTNINCGYTCTAAKAEFFAAESPEVTVALGKGTSKVTWVSGAGTCTGNALTCTVPMSSAHSLVAKFE